jgi:hypothetical protein
MYSDVQRLADLDRAESTIASADNLAEIKAALLLICRAMKHSAAETVAETDMMLGITRLDKPGTAS